MATWPIKHWNLYHKPFKSEMLSKFYSLPQIAIRCLIEKDYHILLRKYQSLRFYILDSGKKVGKTVPQQKYGILRFLPVLDSETKIEKTDHPPHLPSPSEIMGLWDFANFGLRNKSWKNWPHSKNIGLWDFASFELRIKSWKNSSFGKKTNSSFRFRNKSWENWLSLSPTLPSP